MHLTAFFLFVAASGIVLGEPSKPPAAEPFDPPALYLTWQRNPSTTMTVHWHTIGDAGAQAVQYRPATGGIWRTVAGETEPLPESDRHIHTAELTRLEPGGDYLFRFGEGAREYKFRTAPGKLDQPVRFIAAGDMYHRRDWLEEMARLAALQDPLFVVIGGDISYSNEDPQKLGRWFDFFESWKKCAVAPDGRLIPMVVTIGNHETRGYWFKTPEASPYFNRFFPTPGSRGYNHLDFGKYLTLVLLNSWHTAPVAGDQTAWLEQVLKRSNRVPHVIAAYHIPAYPSCRPYEGGENGVISEAIREHWSPLFERHGVQLAFENHDHAFKRTHPIRAGKIDPEGVVYLGDGAWGVNLRTVHPPDQTWYLAKAEAVRHFFLVTLHPDRRHVAAINPEGAVIDELHQRVRPTPAKD